AAGGEIFNQCVAERDEAFKERDVIRLINQILTGVAFLHRNNVVHLDLKPQNILLTSSNPLGDIRIVDFGLSRKVDNVEEVREILGTPEYVAPEILNYEPISTATDMWTIGVLTYVMLTGISPFLGDDKQTTYLNISRVDVDYTQDVFEGISDLALDFLQTLLIKDPRAKRGASFLPPHTYTHTRARTLAPGGEKEPTRLLEEEKGRGAGQPGSSSEKLVLVASYTLCRQLDETLDTSRASVRKHFAFEEPFANLPEIQQELVC
uniref:Serine/threonine kinase 17a like n=1 Tax=Callorhinchus milii TaxID=7868 RepID=A0A4W3GSN0_CALMI